MFIKLLLLGGFLPALFLAAPAPAGELAPAEPLQEVPLSNIRLLDSPFKQRQDVHRRVLLGYEVERLLHNFRVNAGLPSPAEPCGGWEAPGCGLRGHFTGHYLSACALMFAATGDPAFQARVAQLVDGLADCQRALGTGYLSAFPISEFEKLETRFFDGVWAPYYTIHKIMTGLLDAYEHAGNLRAREMAVAMAGYFAARLEGLSPEALEKMTLTNYKGNPVNEYGGIAESFLSVYRLTRDARHLAAARVFIRDWFVDPLARGEDQLAGLHANTHIPQARSLVTASEVMKDPRLLRAARFFFDQVSRQRSFAFGGNAFDEKWDAPGVESSKYHDLTGETCNTHNLLQFSRLLFARTGQADYADFHEHALVNHILASVAPEGQTTYHVAAQPGRFKVYGGHDNCFWCCTGTGIENTARYAQGTYFSSGKSLWINQYIPSRVALADAGFTLVQESEFPAGETIRVTLEARQAFHATLRFRRPGWLAGPAELRVNGAAVPARDLSHDGSWLVLDRAWRPGTRLELRLPMGVRTRPAMDNPALVSFFHGPVLLGGALGREAMPESDIVTSQTVYHKLPPIEAPALQSVSADALKPVPGRPLTYTTPTADGRPITLMPFYQLHHQRYSLYWRAAPQPAPSPVKDAPATAGFPPAGSTRKAGAPPVNATASPAHGPLDWARLRNPVWTSADNLRDPSVLKTSDGYLLFYSRLAGTNWASPAGWSIASVFTRDFIRFEGDRDVSPKGYASPGDVVKWHGRYLLPYQSYPASPTQLCFSESPDLQAWSAPKPFLTEARFLRWNTLQRVIDPTLVLEGERLHCYFVGSANVTNAAGKILRANLLGHALTRDPKLEEWEILSTHEPLLGVSERAPDGVENVMIFRTGDLWTMIYSEGLANQHLALATSAGLGVWKTAGPIELPRQKWMARKYGAPFVWREADQWLMILMGENATGKTTFGLLTSPDGSHWTPRPE